MAKLAAGLTAALLCAAAPAAAAAPKVGEPAPDFSVVTYTGRKLSLADLKGDVIVLNFWATWCGPCRAELPLLESYFRQTAKYGVQVLAVATEDGMSEGDLRRVWSKSKLTIPAVHRMKGPYRVINALPTNYVIDRSGKLVYAKAAAFNLDSLNALLVPLMREPMPQDAPPAAPVVQAETATPTAP